jgi:nucleoid-associated protein YgaU
MSDAQRIRDPDGRFSLVPPPGWQHAPDEDEGGMEVWSEQGAGTLHLISFDAGDDFADPAEELYAFLDEREVELEEDDVQDVPLEDGGELALAEYEVEDEDEDDVTFWLVGVATAPGVLVFATYLRPGGAEHEAEAELVRAALGSLRLAAPSA